MKRILIVSYSFPPAGGAGVMRMTKFVKYLPKFGWLPTVLCAQPTQSNPRDTSLLGDIPDEVEVVRLPAPGYSFLNSFRLGRGLLRLGLFPDSNIVWARRVLSAAEELVREKPFDVVLTTDPPSAQWVGYQLQQRTGIPWVMDIRDLWTDAFTYRPISYIHGLLDRRLEAKMLQAADGIVCATSGYPQVLQDSYPQLTKDRFLVIPNGYDEDDFRGREALHDNFFWLTYVGALFDFSVYPRVIGWKRLLEPFIAGGPPVQVRTPAIIIEAMAQIIAKEPDLADSLRIRFVGEFPEEFRKIIRERGLENIVRIDGYVDHATAVQAMLDADVLFLMQAGDGSECVIPGKLYEYMRSGTPILGLFPKGLASKLIRETESGVVIPPENIGSVQDQILHWYHVWKKRGVLTRPDRSAIEHYSRQNQSQRLAKWMLELRAKDESLEMEID